MRITSTLALLGLVFSSSLLAMPKQQAIPGGLIQFELESAQAPQAEFNQSRLLTESLGNNRWRVWLGLGLDLAPGQHQVRINHRNYPFQVQDFAYPEQHLQISDTSKVNPDPKQLERIQREQQQLKQIFARYSPGPAQLDWLKPVQGKTGSAFGLKRFFNEQARAPHSGFDITAAEGTPVKNAAHGQVVMATELFFNGNTVIVDHGQGLLSLYCHLSQIQVQLGQQLTQGQVLGNVGHTGRATGPHLHWGVSLNGVRINPALWLGG